MEFGDICKISNASEEHILEYLEKRYIQDEIYTNASEILIALNPYQDIPHLYGPSVMEVIEKISTPHIYKTAQEALHRIKASGSQSIIIGGVTGSGKTESAKHIIEFLCGKSSPSSLIAKRILASQIIMESFGNARTMGNQNSSRFCKFTQLNYDENLHLVGAQIQQHLLETNRICDANENNFHVFYALLSGGPDHLLKYLSNCLSESDLNQQTTPPLYDFKTIDTTLDKSGFDDGERLKLYKVLIGILLLQKVSFELDESDSDEKVQVSKSSEHILYNLMKLFQLDVGTLENALVSRSIKDKDSVIIINLSIHAAEKSRDTLSKILYDHLFKHIVHRMNTSTPPASSSVFIGILDIAGHESKSHSPNTFDQLSINYVNETFQQFFIQRVLITERQWYDKEKLDVPFIPFLDNSDIIEMFDNKFNGLLSLLDQQCILKEPSGKNFTENFLCAWSKKKNVAARTKMANEFIIRHFSGPVIYSTLDFIEKNLMKLSDGVCSIANEILEPLTEFIPKRVKSSKTVSSNLRIELNGLIKCLASTSTQFIRCVKPNDTKSPRNFDKVLMLQQLKSANINAYAEFMQIGYPTRISFDSLEKTYEQFTSDSIFERDFTAMKHFYTKLLLGIGFQLNDFKFGEKLVFFRAKNSALINDLMESPANSIFKMNCFIAKMAILRFRSTVFGIIFCKRCVRLSKKKHSIHVLPTCSSTKVESIAPEPQPSVKRAAKGARMLDSEMNTRSKNQQKNKENSGTPVPRAKSEKRPKNSMRYDGKGHLPIFDKNSYASRCKNEDCKFKTNMECIKCKVHLCCTRERNCFTEFHLLELNQSD